MESYSLIPLKVNTPGFGGRGGTGGGGAGFGGAIFIRSGNLSLNDITFLNNQVAGGQGGNSLSATDDGKSLGGAIFALNTLTNTNGNNQGMPDTLPTVTVNNVTYNSNVAPDNSNTPTDNNDYYGVEITAPPPNIAPTVANEIPDQTVLVGESFNFQFAENTFNDAEGNDLTYTATLADGYDEYSSMLPDWLDFDETTRTFSSNTNPTSGDIDLLKVKVIASDGTDSVSDIFKIAVVNTVVNEIVEHRGSSGRDGIAGGIGNDIARGGNGGDVIAGNAGADRLHGDAGNDELDGGNDNDFITGGPDDDDISGGEGNDFILGGDGQDNLSGDAGNDVLMGGEGDDILNGGPGADRLSGFAGSDTFILTAGDTDNIIYDYIDGIDKFGLELDSFNNGTVGDVFNNELTIAQNGSSTTISSGADLLATLYNVTATDLTVDDFTEFDISDENPPIPGGIPTPPGPIM